jgi:CRISPR-associated protein Csb1
MADSLSLNRLARAVQRDAAIRRVRRLQPVGGRGDKIYPPTYPGVRNNDPPRHVFERRRVDGQNVLCVLIDSVQSQANRLEEALRAARDAGKLSFPAITVDFSKTEVADIGRITSLDAPHRVFDAIIRDSELDGKRFKDTPEGRRLIEAKSSDARAVFEISPTALVFGAWNSTGEGGGLGAKFPRAVVSEIVGYGVAEERIPGTDDTRPSGQRTGSRIDPLGIRSGVRVYKKPDGDWTLEPAAKGSKEAKEMKEVKPSEVNHSNIAPTVTPLGVSCDYAQHVFVLSCAALRRLRFGQGKEAEAADAAARTVLAALGLAAVVAQDRAGYFLRSRCDLVPEDGAPSGFEIVHADGKTESFELDLEAAADLLKEAIREAEKLGVKWRSSDVELQPQRKLVDLVKQSREKALQGQGEPEDEA